MPQPEQQPYWEAPAVVVEHDWPSPQPSEQPQPDDSYLYEVLLQIALCDKDVEDGQLTVESLILS